LSNEKYLGRFSAYGRPVTLERMYADDWLCFDTPVKGLYVAGEDVYFPGVIGALFTGIAAAARASGYL
jgi:phytoene dehydrogenase-like protein